MWFKVLKYGSLSLSVAIAIVAIVLFYHFTAVKAAPLSYDIGGWFWTDNYGWISLNSSNPSLSDLPNIPYSVAMADGKISGYGWSSNVGWVCFGKTCTGSSPDNIWPVAKMDSNYRMTGWAKILSLGDNGWIHLGQGDSVSGNMRGEQCYDCRTTTTPDGIDILESCRTCFTTTKFNGASIPEGTSADAVAVGGSGDICSDCTECAKNYEQGVVCNTCSSCNKYGGAIDSSDGSFLGWSWNGNRYPDNNAGAGWVQLSPARGVAGLIYPWLETKYGGVYSGGNVRQKSTVSGVNATYCIFAKNISNFTSKAVGCPQNPTGDSIQFPQANSANSQSYNNVLGRIDLEGLTTIAKPNSQGNGYNKYGNFVKKIKNTDDFNSALNSQVFVADNDLIIDSALTIPNGSGGISGSGLVIVNGDLNINSNISYSREAVTGDNLKQLASIAWIVRGDIIVNGKVANIAGAYIALGGRQNILCKFSDGSPCNSVVDYPKYLLDSYGVFSSGESATQPLVISGLLLAKAFNFERTYTSITQGSEKIIYDGRMSANPPPGLKGLLEALPVIRDF